MYIYFMTSRATSISHTISPKGYADYTNTAYQAKKYQKEHEFQLIGLLPNTTNTIILKATTRMEQVKQVHLHRKIVWSK